MATCRVCNNTIPPERLERWPWAKTCCRDCADGLAVETDRRARKAYRDRRRVARKAAGTKAPLMTPRRSGLPQTRGPVSP